MRSQKGNKTALKKIVFFLALLLGFFTSSVLFKRIISTFVIFKAEELDCFKNNIPCDQLTTEYFSDLLVNQSLLSLKPSEIEKAYISQYPFTTKVSVKTIYPKKIRVDIQSNQKSFYVFEIPNIDLTSSPSTTSSTPSSSVRFKTLEKILKIDSTSNLTLESGGYLNFNPTKAESNVFISNLNKIDAQAKLSRLYLYLSEVERNQLHFKWLFTDLSSIYLQNEVFKAILSLDSDPVDTITSLQQIRASSTIDLSNAIIDLRFTKPIITNQ